RRVGAPPRVPPGVAGRGAPERRGGGVGALQGSVPGDGPEAGGRSGRRGLRARPPTRALMPVTEVVFPLTPRRRLIGLSFGGMRSARRGPGSDVAGSRQYRPGDNIDTIDWAASARLSSARATDEFIVRERFAEEAPRVVIVCDRRPEMQLFPPWLPWLSKPDAVRTAALMIADSTIAARGYSGYLDFA